MTTQGSGAFLRSAGSNCLFRIEWHQLPSRIPHERTIRPRLERHRAIAVSELHNPVHACTTRCKLFSLRDDYDCLEATSAVGDHGRNRIDFCVDIVAAESMLYIATGENASIFT